MKNTESQGCIALLFLKTLDTRHGNWLEGKTERSRVVQGHAPTGKKRTHKKPKIYAIWGYPKINFMEIKINFFILTATHWNHPSDFKTSNDWSPPQVSSNLSAHTPLVASKLRVRLCDVWIIFEKGMYNQTEFQVSHWLFTSLTNWTSLATIYWHSPSRPLFAMTWVTDVLNW